MEDTHGLCIAKFLSAVQPVALLAHLSFCLRASLHHLLNFDVQRIAEDANYDGFVHNVGNDAGFSQVMRVVREVDWPVGVAIVYMLLSIIFVSLGRALVMLMLS